ncbi:MAG: FHA domain-containing protein [Lachnospiraceae bacterium]|nr:FHA domain-containing protein [Lachnospiraceae bacterium]
MKKLARQILCCTLLFFMMMKTADAAEATKVIEIQESGTGSVIFVKGIEEEVQSATAIVGNTEAADVQILDISSGRIPMKTLILMDNSLSIPEGKRESIKEVIGEILAGREESEQIALATFGESIEILSDFTNDYVSLKQVLEEIEFQDRETYLTDVLYELISGNSFGENEDLIYARIFVVSDGVDNKSLGYTTEELKALLGEKTIPIYSMGVYNRSQSNEEELKNMFALSRQTNAESFLLDELDHEMDVALALAEDRDIVAFLVIPNDTSRDGSKKTVSLHIQTEGGEVVVQADNVRMSQEAVSREEITETEPVVSPVLSEEEKVEKSDGKMLNIGLIGGGVFIGLILVILGIIVVSGKKKKRSEIKEVDDPFAEMMPEEGRTVLVVGESNSGSGGETIQLFEDSSCYITLTDIANPSRSFRNRIQDRLVIGRSASKVDICIDYDQSVSGRHCTVERRGNRFFVIDLQSSNKTFVNDSQVLSEVEVYSGSIIKLGRVKLRIEMD